MSNPRYTDALDAAVTYAVASGLAWRKVLAVAVARGYVDLEFAEDLTGDAISATHELLKGNELDTGLSLDSEEAVTYTENLADELLGLAAEMAQNTEQDNVRSY